MHKYTVYIPYFYYDFRKETFEKSHFFLDNAIGCPLGSIFEVKGSKLRRLDTKEDVDELLIATHDTGWKIFYQYNDNGQYYHKIFNIMMIIIIIIIIIIISIIIYYYYYYYNNNILL